MTTNLMNIKIYYINSNAIKPLIKPIKVIESTDKINNIESEKEVPKEIEKKIYLMKQKYYNKVSLLESIFGIYCSEEFQKKYDEYLAKNLDKRVKYIYEIILEILFYYCLYFDEVNKIDIISDFAKNFYEYENVKINVLKRYQNDLIRIKDQEGKDLDLSKRIKNKIYKVTIGDFVLDLNFYDFRVKNYFIFLCILLILTLKIKNNTLKIF